MATFNLFIAMAIFFVDADNNTIIENCKIPLHLVSPNFECARSQALEIAQGIARGFSCTKGRSAAYFLITTE